MENRKWKLENRKNEPLKHIHRGETDFRARIRAAFIAAYLLVGTVLLFAGHLDGQPASDMAQGIARSGLQGQIRVAFTSETGIPMSRPAKDDIHMKLGGKPAQVNELRSLEAAPLYFSILVDISGSTKDIAAKQSAIAMRLFQQLDQGGNYGHLVLFNSNISASDRFLSPSEFEKALAQFPANSRKGSTALYDAIGDAVTLQLPDTKLPPNSRRALVILSYGEDNSSKLSLMQIVKKAEQADIPIFALAFDGLTSSRNQRAARHAAEALATLSERTGGQVLDATKADLADELVKLLRTQALILFDTGGIKEGQSYSLKFESPGQKTHILGPLEYVAP